MVPLSYSTNFTSTLLPLESQLHHMRKHKVWLITLAKRIKRRPEEGCAKIPRQRLQRGEQRPKVSPLLSMFAHNPPHTQLPTATPLHHQHRSSSSWVAVKTHTRPTAQLAPP